MLNFAGSKPIAIERFKYEKILFTADGIAVGRCK